MRPEGWGTQGLGALSFASGLVGGAKNAVAFGDAHDKRDEAALIMGHPAFVGGVECPG